MKNLQYMLSTFQLFLVLLSLYWLLRWADFFAFFFLRVASHRLRSALVYALGFANTYIANGQPRCPPHPLSPRNVVLTSSCNACIRYPARAHERKLTFRTTSNDIPKRYRKLTFLSVTDMYVRTYIRMDIARIDPSFKASR